MLKIAQILAPERIVIAADCASKKSVLEKLAELLASAAPELNSQKVFECLLARERLGTTGLGAGIAIPHGRVVHNGQAVGAFLRTSRPIGFDAVDNAPVDLFFALCVPEAATAEHLALLAELARLFSNQQLVAQLREAPTANDLYACLTGASHA
jgi:nitrogen PTS system EIIA component